MYRRACRSVRSVCYGRVVRTLWLWLQTVIDAGSTSEIVKRKSNAPRLYNITYEEMYRSRYGAERAGVAHKEVRWVAVHNLFGSYGETQTTSPRIRPAGDNLYNTVEELYALECARSVANQPHDVLINLCTTTANVQQAANMQPRSIDVMILTD